MFGLVLFLQLLKHGIWKQKTQTVSMLHKTYNDVMSAISLFC